MSPKVIKNCLFTQAMSPIAVTKVVWKIFGRRRKRQITGELNLDKTITTGFICQTTMQNFFVGKWQFSWLGWVLEGRYYWRKKDEGIHSRVFLGLNVVFTGWINLFKKCDGVLSGGEKVRVCCLEWCWQKPRNILILDEPTQSTWAGFWANPLLHLNAHSSLMEFPRHCIVLPSSLEKSLSLLQYCVS